MAFYNSQSTFVYISSFDSQSNPQKRILWFHIKGNRGMKSSRSLSLNELISDRVEIVSSRNIQGWTLVLPFKVKF